MEYYILEQDRLNRHPNGIIYTEINEFKLLTSKHKNTIRVVDNATMYTRNFMFKNNMYNVGKVFKNLDLENCIVTFDVYGSSENTYNVFVYNDYENVLQRITNHFKDCHIFITKYYISFCESWYGRPFNSPFIVQLVLTKYESIADILYSIDVGSNQIGFDNDNTYFTVLSKFALETGLNIFDVIRRRTSYEYRLYKSLDEGFGLIDPYYKGPLYNLYANRGNSVYDMIYKKIGNPILSILWLDKKERCPDFDVITDFKTWYKKDYEPLHTIHTPRLDLLFYWWVLKDKVCSDIIHLILNRLSLVLKYL